MSRTGNWSLNPLVCGAHSQIAASFACSSRCRQNLNILPLMLANQMRAVPADYELAANYELTRTVPANYVLGYEVTLVLLQVQKLLVT